MKGFFCKGTTGGGDVIIIGEHAEKWAERFSGGLECLPKPVLNDSFGAKDIGFEKGPAHRSVNALFLSREGGPFGHRKLDEPSKARAEVGQEVTAEHEQVTDTLDRLRSDVLHAKIFENLRAVLVVLEGGEGILQVARRRSRLKTATGSRIGAITATRSRSGASDSRGRSGVVLNFILCLPSRHSLESRACCYEGSLGGAVVTAAACATKRGTGSAGKQTVRRSCARKVGCRLLARM
jgi:hypothetical protein